VTLNRLCEELDLGKMQRNSVPLAADDEASMRQSLEAMKESSEEWRAMKLVVLGHGRVGKTTLLHKLKSFIASKGLDNQQNVHFSLLFFFSFFLFFSFLFFFQLVLQYIFHYPLSCFSVCQHNWRGLRIYLPCKS